MSKFLESLKDKKTLVSVICAIVCVGILFFAYKTRVDKKVKSISVPYALVEIKPRTLITESMVKTVKVASSMLTENVIRTTSDVIGKYANYNTTIPEGSLFYKSAVVDWTDMPDSAWKDIEEGNTVLSLSITGNVMVSNAIYPGAVIDLYYKTTDNGKLVYGKFIENIQVLAVKDSSGNQIFEKTNSKTSVSSVIFSLNESNFLLLKEASYLGGTIVPVLRNAAYTSDDSKEVSVSSAYIKQLIEDRVHAVTIDEVETGDDVGEVVIDGEKKTDNTTNNTTNNTNTNGNSTNKNGTNVIN